MSDMSGARWPWAVGRRVATRSPGDAQFPATGGRSMSHTPNSALPTLYSLLCTPYSRPVFPGGNRFPCLVDRSVANHEDQSTMERPGINRKSLTLRVTRVPPCSRVIAAMRRSACLTPSFRPLR